MTGPTPGYEFLADELVKRDAEIERLLAENKIYHDNQWHQLKEAHAEIERLRAALQAITDQCKIEPANPFLADDMDRTARAALEPKP